MSTTEYVDQKAISSGNSTSSKVRWTPYLFVVNLADPGTLPTEAKAASEEVDLLQSGMSCLSKGPTLRLFLEAGIGTATRSISHTNP